MLLEVKESILIMICNMAVCRNWLHHHILSVSSYRYREIWDSVSINTVQFMICENDCVHYSLKIVFVCLHILHLIIIMQTYLKTLGIYKSFRVYSVDRVFTIRPILSVIFHTIQYMRLCAISSLISLMMIEGIFALYLIIIIKSEIWIISHYLMLCHETMVCAVCLLVFL